jgi:hypothetical protein
LSIILKSTTTICRSENHRSPDEQGAGDGPLFMAHSAKRRQLVPPKNRGFIPAATHAARRHHHVVIRADGRGKYRGEPRHAAAMLMLLGCYLKDPVGTSALIRLAAASGLLWIIFMFTLTFADYWSRT